MKCRSNGHRGNRAQAGADFKIMLEHGADDVSRDTLLFQINDLVRAKIDCTDVVEK